jgi:hypothetical protein
VSGDTAVASPWSSDPSRTAPNPHSPDACIVRNGGDYNACNVGSSRGGSGPYSAAYTPNDCITRNGGDWNACNVGNSGSGDRPYRHV